jgi:hypothetical protein
MRECARNSERCRKRQNPTDDAATPQPPLFEGYRVVHLSLFCSGL